MPPEHEDRITEIFAEALARAPEERSAFLDRACGADAGLRSEVESLLAAHPRAKGILDRAARSIAATGAPEPDAGKQVGPYRLTTLIASGGMASVYLAERGDQEFEKRVAVKLIRPGLDTEEILARFRNERQVLADLEHPNIARLLDGGSTPDNLPYLVMEHVDGERIHHYSDARRLSVNERLLLFLQVCEAVAYAHRNMVIHRDLKPSNILVDQSGQVKLLDFGIAKVLEASGAGDHEATMTTFRAMTPRYASPEQFRGRRVTTATDVYSLGVVLYELLTGALPYDTDGATPTEVERMICEAAPTRMSRAALDGGEVSERRRTTPQRLAQRLSGDLDTIVLRALSKEPERRYPSVEEFAADIRRHLDGFPVLARPDTAAYRLSKFVRRNTALVAGVTAFFLLLVTALAVVTSLYRDAQESAATARWHAYTSTMAATESAIMNHHMDEARNLMNTITPEFRGWEWRHLQGRLDRSLVNWRAHSRGITRIRFSPDGSRILTAGIDHAARIWETATRDTIAAWTFDSEIESGAFFPDGRRVALGMTDGRVMVATSGNAEPESIGAGTPYAIVEVAPDGRVVAAGFDNGEMALIDVDARREIRRWKAHSKFAVPRFSPDGRLLATAGADSVVRIWDAGSGGLKRVLSGHRHRVYTMAFSRDGRTLVTGSMDRTAAVWDIETGSALRSFSEHRGTVAGLAIHPSGKEVLSAGSEGRVMVWDAATGSRTAEYHGHNEADVTTVDISTDGTLSVTADWEGWVRLWRWGTDDVSGLALPRTADVVRILDLDLDPSGRELVGTTSSRRAFTCGILERSLAIRGLAGTSAVAALPSGGLLTADPTGRLLRFDEQQGPPDTVQSEGPVTSLAASGARSLVASGGQDGTVRLWRLPGFELHREMKGHRGTVYDAEFSPTQSILATAGQDSTVRLWDTETGDSLCILGPNGSTVWHIAFHPDGRLLASAESDGSAQLWDLESRSLAATLLPNANGAFVVGFSPDGERVAVGGSDQLIHVFDVPRRSEILRLHGHIGRVSAVRFTPDSRTLVSAGHDGLIRFWEAPAPAGSD
jgi:WD40 repeat protein/serine/threonine protein kinase